MSEIGALMGKQIGFWRGEKMCVFVFVCVCVCLYVCVCLCVFILVTGSLINIDSYTGRRK